MSDKARIVITMVTYRSNLEQLQEAINSLHNTLKVPYCIMLVDNNSGKKYQEQLNAIERINVILSPKNYGFGFGHNLASRRAPDSDFILIMNPDVVVHPGTLDTMMSYMEDYPHIGILAPKVYNPDGTHQPQNRRLPSLFVLFARRFLPEKLRDHPWVKQKLDAYEMKDVGYDQVMDVPFVSGCFMLFRREVFDRIGGFDERFFMYLEDCDITRRINKAGMRSIYLPQASITHHWQRGSHSSKKLMLVMIKSMLTYFNKWGWHWV